MRKLLSLLLILASFALPVASQAQSILRVPQGGSGVGTITGIIQGNGTAPFSAITVGSGLNFAGGTLSATASGGDCPNALNLEVLVSDGTDCQGDPLFTRNAATGEFGVAGTLGASPFDLSSIFLGTANGNIEGSFLQHSVNGGVNGDALVFVGDETISGGPALISGIVTANFLTAHTSEVFVLPDEVILSSDDGVVYSEMILNKNKITYEFDGTNTIDFFSPTKGSIILGDGAGNQTFTGEDNLVFGGNSDGFEAAGVSLTTGDENIFLGKGTGRLMTAASRNIIIGSGAGSSTGIGGLVSDNVIIGRGAGTFLGASAAGDGNVILGVGTGTNINANYNIAIGYQAMGSSTGSANIAIGASALSANTSGINIGIGDSVGQGITTGTANILIGSIAGNSLATTSSNNTIIGWQAGVNNEGNRNTFVGASSATSPLGDDNTAVGYLTLNTQGSGLDQTINYATILGSKAMKDPRTGSDYSTAIGYEALTGLTTGSFNTALGANAGDSITTGSFNTLLGANAGAALTLGIENTFVGLSAATSMTGAQNITSGNVIQGMYASVDRTRGNFNTIIGTRADQAASTGDSNTILGYSAGFGLTTGASNIMIGAVAGANVTTAQGIFIGVGADSFFNGVGMIALGSSAVTTASNQMVVGSTATPVNDYFFGSGVLSGTPTNVTFNAGGANGVTIAGGDFTTAGGKGTGLASPGSVKSQTSVPTSATTSTLQTLGDRSVILGDYTTLTETTATSVVRVSIPTDTVAGGSILVTVEANDLTDFQSRTLEAEWSAVNKAGTITTGLSTPVEAIAVSAGTLTCTLTAVDAGGGNADFDIDCTSSLTQTTLRANAQVLKNFGTGAIIAQ